VSRIFLAVPLEAAVEAEVLKVKQENEGIRKVVWMRTHNLHLTVYFIGHVPRANAPLIIEKIRPLLTSRKSIPLILDKVCKAPEDKPRMVWVRFERSAAFTQLAGDIHEAVAEFIPINPFHFRDPIPHITLARFRANVDTHALLLPHLNLSQFVVNKCELWESVPAKEGVKYECRERFMFEG
jgi:2'-5' RNA ligase